MRSGTAHLPLHSGRAPAWLFSRMVLLAYDKTIEVLHTAVNRANVDRSERVKALKRLVEYGKERVSKRPQDAIAADEHGREQT